MKFKNLQELKSKNWNNFSPHTIKEISLLKINLCILADVQQLKNQAASSQKEQQVNFTRY